jgi:hypothetical protein
MFGSGAKAAEARLSVLVRESAEVEFVVVAKEERPLGRLGQACGCA